MLFAIESGSRAWGFASPDSDYDIRFIYRHPHDWYLSLHESRDVIERGIDGRDIDLSGWDLRKALRLLLKWNPALHEWLVSPITYSEAGTGRSDMLALYEAHADLRAVAYHYLSIAKAQWSRMRTGDEVRLKKYFYVIRPLMALHWLDVRSGVPPMNFAELREAGPWPQAMDNAIDDLIAMKRETPELGSANRIEVIDHWIEDVLAKVDPTALARTESQGAARSSADALFLKFLQGKRPRSSARVICVTGVQRHRVYLSYIAGRNLLLFPVREYMVRNSV